MLAALTVLQLLGNMLNFSFHPCCRALESWRVANSRSTYLLSCRCCCRSHMQQDQWRSRHWMRCVTWHLKCK